MQGGIDVLVSQTKRSYVGFPLEGFQKSVMMDLRKCGNHKKRGGQGKRRREL